jgi:hypothetical protein
VSIDLKHTCRDCLFLKLEKTNSKVSSPGRMAYRCIADGTLSEFTTSTEVCDKFQLKTPPIDGEFKGRHPMVRDPNKSDWGISTTSTSNFSKGDNVGQRQRDKPFCPACEYLKPTLAQDGFDCDLLDKDSDLWIPQKWLFQQEMQNIQVPAWCPRLKQELDTSSCFTCAHIRGGQVPMPRHGGPPVPLSGWCGKHQNREIPQATSMKSCYLWEPNKDLIHPCQGYNGCDIDEDTGLCRRCGRPEDDPTFWDPTVK